MAKPKPEPQPVDPRILRNPAQDDGKNLDRRTQQILNRKKSGSN